jgi:hypothetical protein
VIEHILLLDQRCLTTNLGTDLIVRKTGGREKRDLLTSGNGVHHIDGRDTRLDHFLRVHSLIGVNGLALY